jgi:hypothetical protein
MEDVGIFYGRFVNFPPLGILCGFLVKFPPFWYIAPRKIWQPFSAAARGFNLLRQKAGHEPDDSAKLRASG